MDSKIKKIAIITTIKHNIGDDFVREGIIFLLREYFGEIECYNIHKHIPETVRKGFSGIRNKKINSILSKLPSPKIFDKILSSNILIQSGAPVFWCHHKTHCADNEWYQPLITHRYLKIKNKTPFLNIGAGTCQQYNSDENEFLKCAKCRKYINELTKLTKITIVRDKLAKKLLNKMGIEVKLLPCPSIFAANNLKISPQKPEYVCLNYMPIGGHYDFAKNIDSKRWEKIFRSFYNHIKNKYRCIFVCHDQKELKVVKNIDANARTFFSKNHKDYLKLYSRAKCGIINRVHAGFAIANFGRPSFIIGNDSRVKMVEEIKLSHELVYNITVEKLICEFNKLLLRKTYKEEFENIKKMAYEQYLQFLQKIDR